MEPFLTMFNTVNTSPLLVYQVRFYANKYFEQFPIVSSASTVAKAQQNCACKPE